MKKFRDIRELELFYQSFENKTLKSLLNYVHTNYPDISISTNKGVVGQVLEALIGNPPNSSPHPDVDYLGIELKVLPVRKLSGKLQPKERSKIKSINYHTIIDEEWVSSLLRNKVKRILFLIYEQPTGKTYKDWLELHFKGTLFFELNSVNEPVIKKDWSVIQYKVKNEIAHKLSEGDGKILGAATSGSGRLITYSGDKQAKERSYSLKHSFLKIFYNEHKNNVKYQSLDISEDIKPEAFIISKINESLKGKLLGEVVSMYNLRFSSTSKAAFRLLLNKTLNIESESEILELDEQNLVVKTIPVNKNYSPLEAMSFPKFSLLDLMNEDWDGEECEFRDIISKGYIFIPIVKEKIKGTSKFKDWRAWEIGEAEFWKADTKQLETIRKEWKRAKSIVSNGVKVNRVKWGNRYRQENNLLKSSETDFIHIRPHARDSKDIDIPYYEFSKVQISWQSFWLNREFVKEIIRK